MSTAFHKRGSLQGCVAACKGAFSGLLGGEGGGGGGGFLMDQVSVMPAQNLVAAETLAGFAYHVLLVSSLPCCAQVYKALLNGVQEVAVKIFFDVHTAREEADILREVAILKGCRDRNVVQFYGACLEVRPRYCG